MQRLGNQACMPCQLFCKSTKRLPGFSYRSLLSGILPRDMQYSTTTALQVPLLQTQTCFQQIESDMCPEDFSAPAAKPALESR